MDLKDDVLDRFKTVLKDTNLSQKEFGDSVGSSSASILSLFNGRVKSLSGNMVKLLEVVHGVNPVWLETGMGKKYIREPRLNNEDEIKLITNFRSLNASNQQLVYMISETLYKQMLKQKPKNKPKKK